MVDPTSDVGEVDADEAPSCATCGAGLAEAPDRRVLTWIEDGLVRHRHFCGDDCLAVHGDAPGAGAAADGDPDAG